MTAPALPTVRSRELGRALREAMRRTGGHADDLAERMDWAPDDLDRLLRGRQVPDAPDLASLLVLCHVTGARRTELLALAHDAHEKTWWHDYGTHVPIHQPALADNERAATTITCYRPTLVPDLAQTAGYARALAAARPTIPRPEIDLRVAGTLRRQRTLHRPEPPALRIFLDEYAVTRTGAGPAVMAEQARHLLALADRAGVEVRIVPDATETPDSTPCTLLEFTDLSPVVGPVVYVEHPTSTAFLERTETVTAYRRVLTELDRVALGEPASRRWLAERVTTAQ